MSLLKFLKITNWCLSVLLVFLGLYLVLGPKIPEITYSFSPNQILYPEQANTGISDQNMLIISKIGVNSGVYEGDSKVLAKGVWHRPGTGDPESGGNMVMVAHRYMYFGGPISFYHLDKVNIGDKISVYWKGVQYDYRVTEIEVVEPTRIDIEANTSEPQLTLYTCTPLWTATHRLVVIAKPA